MSAKIRECERDLFVYLRNEVIRINESHGDTPSSKTNTNNNRLFIEILTVGTVGRQ